MNFTREHRQNRFRFSERRLLFSIWPRNDPSSNRSRQAEIVEQMRLKAFALAGIHPSRGQMHIYFDKYMKNQNDEANRAIYTFPRHAFGARIHKKGDENNKDEELQLPHVKYRNAFSPCCAGMPAWMHLHYRQNCGNRRSRMTSATMSLWQKSGDPSTRPPTGNRVRCQRFRRPWPHARRPKPACKVLRSQMTF